MVDREDRGALVGRGAEEARLDAALEAAATGHGTTIIVGGEAGIGKTRLVGRVVATARERGSTVLSGACLAAGSGAIPYAPFVEALRELTRSVEPGLLAAQLGPSRNEIARLLPEVAPRTREIPTGSEFDREGQTRLFEAVLGVIERQARDRPVVLVVEDIQWADDGTRGLLGFLSRNLREAPVVLLATLRTDELDRRDPVLAFVAELERDAWVVRLDLRGLDRHDVLVLMRELGGVAPSAATVDDVMERSGGNPFFVEQLAAASTADVTGRTLPPGLRDVLVARLAGLPPDTQQVLRAASAAGRRVDDELLAAVLEMPAGAVADALRPAITQGILVDADRFDDTLGGYAFRHALLAEVANGELLHGERDRFHAAFGQELERRGEIGGVPVTPAELAYHWVAARDRTRALPALVAAGAAAERVYAFAEARRHYERALELWDDDSSRGDAGPDRIGVLQRAAECAVLTGAYERAVQLGRMAINAAEIAAATGDERVPDRLGVLHDRLRWYLWEAGDVAAAQAAVEEALRLTPAQPPTAARTRILAQAAGLRLLSGDPSGAATMARDAIQIAEAIARAVRGGPGARHPRLGRGPDRRRGRRDRHVPPWAVDRRATGRCRRDRARARQPRRPARSGRAHRGVAGSCARGVRDRATPWRAPHVRRRPPGSRGQGPVRSRPLGRGCGGRRSGARARSGRSFRDLAPSQPGSRGH